MENKSNEVLSTKETLQLLGNISRSTLQRIIDRGELTPIPDSPVLLRPRALRFRREDVEELLKKSRGRVKVA